MKATIKNYHELVSKHGAPEHLKDAHNNFMKEASANNWEAYHADKEVKKAVHEYLAHYSKWNKIAEAGKKTKAAAKTKAEKKPKASAKPKAEPKPKPGRKVNKVRPDVYLIRRFAALANHDIDYIRAEKLLLTLQRCVADKRVTKKSRYAPQVESIQVALITVCNRNKPGDKVHIAVSADTLAAYEKIGHAQRVYPAIILIKYYLKLQGQRVDKHKVQMLHDRVKNTLQHLHEVSQKDPLRPQLEEVEANLAKHLHKSGDFSIHFAERHLRGLLGIDGLEGLKVTHRNHAKLAQNLTVKNGVVKSTDFIKENYPTIGLKGKYKTFLGDLHKGFSMIVFGKPGQGKTTWALCLAKHLAEHHGKVIYASNEEFGSKTLQEKLKFAGGADKNLDFSEDLEKVNLNHYDFLFIDSIQRLGMSLTAFKALRKKYPHLAVVLIGQVNKKGQMKGAQEWEHETGATVEVDREKAVTTKNRYNGLGEMKIR